MLWHDCFVADHSERGDRGVFGKNNCAKNLFFIADRLFQVRTTNEMWRYIKLSFVPALDTGDRPYIADGTNILVGVARIRQLRIVAGTVITLAWINMCRVMMN